MNDDKRDQRTRASGEEPKPPKGHKPRAPEPLLVRVHRAGNNPEAFPLDTGRTYTLGRSSTADIQFDDDRVSRIHATLKFDEVWNVVDAMSANGTHVCRADEHRRTLGTDEDLDAQVLRPGQLAALSTGSAVLIGSRYQWLEILAEPPKSISDEPGAKTRISFAGKRFHQELLRASHHTASVFLLGASGSGKTHAARFIHDHSGARGRFVLVNCAALPSDPTQLRSMLFGHVKGAFTGADKEMQGRLYEAHEGTLFLDEVDSLGTVAQGFLLDVIERTGNLLPLGISEKDAPRPPMVRFVSASKLPLKRTRLRTDLTHRLADGDLVRVPDLSERKEDIRGLVEAFLEEIGRERKTRARMSSEAMKRLVDARWPGEIRQLRSVVEATVRACADREERGALIIVNEKDVAQRLEDVRDAFGDDVFSPIGDAAAGADAPEHETSTNTRAWTTRDTFLINQVSDGHKPAPNAHGDTASPTSVNPRRLTAAIIHAALLATNNNIEHAAEKLGIARRTLMKKMDELGVVRPLKKR